MGLKNWFKKVKAFLSGDVRDRHAKEAIVQRIASRQSMVFQKTPEPTLQDVLDDAIDGYFKHFPLNTDLFEYPKYKDYIVAPTKENIAAYEQFLVETLAKATALNQTNFTAVQKSDYTALVEFIEVEKLRLSLWSFELPTNHMFLPMLSIEVGRSSAMENVTDFENYKKRLFCLPAFIDAMIDGFRAGMDAKVTLPSESIQGMIEYCSSCTEDASNSSFLNVEKIKKTGSNPEEIVSIIRFYVNPAFLKLQTFLREEYIHHARQSAGIHGLPDAKRFYSDMIYFSTSVRYTPDELHQLGLEEVERIAKRMEETKSKVFEGTFGEFRKALDEGKFPEYKLQKPEDAVDHYKSLVTEINKIMPKYFNKFPKFECNVVACPPSSEGNAPMAFYLPGTSTEAGAFMTNLKLAGSKGMQQAMALTLHEAIPGHHHQISLDLESTGKHLIHKMTFQTAYAEGWGLYSEYLGEEMGMYKDAISLYGRLELEMHRALRLVVDTGLHAKGWTIEQSIEYISKYHILSHDETVSEVKRYAIMPGQALAYKVGEIQIRKLRKEAEEALGSQFDIKAFHDVVLDHGSVTMETLAFNVREWIKEELKKPSLQRLMDKILDIFFEESGLFAEMYEYNKYPDTLYRRSKKMIEDQMAALRAVVAEAKSYDHTKFTEKEKQDFLAIEQVMQHMEIEDKCWSLEIPISHLSVSHMPMALTRIQQINNPTDYANYQKRLRIFEHLIGDYIEGFKAGLAAGVTLPLESIELIISGCNQLSTCELDQSPFLCGDKIKAAGLDVEEAKAIIRDVVNPAYQRFVAFMEQEYRQHARKHAGIFGLKDAEKVYADTIYLHTSVRYTPDELHNLGLQEVERIAKRMEETKNQVFEGSMEEFRAALKEGSRFPQYKLEKPEDAIDFYKNTLKEINDVMPKYFNKFPKFECDIQAVPKQAEDNSPTAFYLPGTSTRAGTFMANLKLCGSAMYQAMALTLHEAIPGHHHQLSLEFEDQSRHLVHKLNFHTAYAEGWGLYSEYLGEEMGMYKDPVSLYGRLEFEMHRALRLVVDTGLHAKGWTLEQAAELMRQHLTFPEEDIQSEVKRYSIMPGQALAYKVGEIQIKKLRKEAEEALGSQFDIRSFHQVVLDHGSVSMETLAVNVREWIKEELKKPSLRRLMDKTLDVALRDVGIYGDMLGYPKYKDSFMRVSKQIADKQILDIKAILAEAEGYDQSKFSEQDKQDFETIKTFATDLELRFSCWETEIPMTHFRLSSVPMILTRYQEIQNQTDYDNYKKRLAQVKDLIGDYLEGFQVGLKSNITLPKDSVDLMIETLDEFITAEPEKSPFLCGDKIKKSGFDTADATKIIKDSIVPELVKLQKFLKDKYLSKARKMPGIYGLTGYEKVYETLIYLRTSVRYTSDELHQLGLEEVERIAKRMEETKSKVFEGSLEDFRKALNDGKSFPQYKIEKPEDAIDHYKSLLVEINKVMPKYFNKFPKFQCEIKAFPEGSEKGRAMAIYMPGTKTTPGSFIANVKLSGEKGLHQAMALTLHEAIPGHHHQVSLALEQAEGHMLQKLVAYNSFAEGWGLYAEHLGEEMGMYKDAISLYGRLELEMHRALRLVVDTGLHAKGWSFDKCFDLMRQHLTLTDGEIISEVKRYCVMPAQALAYKVGEIQIKKLRKEAEEALGSQFDVKAFHDVVLDHGSVSMETLAFNVREWIKEELKKPSLRRLMDKMLDTTFKNFGLYSDVFEYPKYKDILMIDNKEAMEKMLAEMHEIVKEAEGYDHSKFSEQDKQDFLLMKDLVQQIALGHSCWGVEIPMTHFSVSDIPRTLAHYQQINNAQDYENYKKRLGQFKQMIEGYIQGFKLGLEAGITLPVESVDLMIVSCGKLISTELEKSPFLCGGKIKKAGLDPQPAMDIIKDSVLPVYEQLKTFLEQEYLPKARKTPGIYGLKDAERIYGDMIYLSTSVRYEPKELHQLGLEEVERIAKRMEETKSKVFEGTLAEFRTALKEGKFPEYKLKEPKDAVDYYKNLVKEIGEIMPKYFNKFPKFECNIQAVEEAAEDSSPLAFYMVGTSQTPGVFMTNLKLAGSKGMQQAMALTLHEAIPGHHHQVSLEFEDENSHTLKKLASCTSYAEGWGLYAEYLGEEMGMYKDGISLYGRLELEMHRALRLVVDTGLHAMGWSFDKCVDLMRQHLTLTEEEILSEVKRYSIMPGQALAYKVGEIQIRKLRKEAEEALGSQFDIKAFHDVVLDHGSVTMETLAVNVREWIQQELKSRKEE